MHRSGFHYLQQDTMLTCSSARRWSLFVLTQSRHLLPDRASVLYALCQRCCPPVVHPQPTGASVSGFLGPLIYRFQLESMCHPQNQAQVLPEPAAQEYCLCPTVHFPGAQLGGSFCSQLHTCEPKLSMRIPVLLPTRAVL